MQHGEAASEQEDPQRPLTASGRASVQNVARRARDAGVRLARCFHSGKLRAEQSAELLADALGVARGAPRAGLAPNDPPKPIAEWLRDFEAPAAAVVGHL